MCDVHFCGAEISLKKGLCWRVGNGQNILAHKDPWIPSIPSFTSTSVSSSINNNKVERYILTTGGWDEQAIRQDFIPWVAEAILDIPLPCPGT